MDVDDVPEAIPLFFGLSESPKGSWLHGFGEPTPLKLPKNAVWPDPAGRSKRLLKLDIEGVRPNKRRSKYRKEVSLVFN